MLYAAPAATTGILPQAGGAFAPGPYFPESVTPLAALRARFDHVSYAKGCELTGHEPPDLDGRCIPLVRDADVVVCCVGRRVRAAPALDERRVPRRDEPRSHRVRSGVLVEAVIAIGTPVVVVVLSGRVHALAVARTGRPRSCTRGARASRAARVWPTCCAATSTRPAAADHRPAQRGTDPDASRPSRRRRAQPDARRLRRLPRRAALPVRPRPLVHDVGVRPAGGRRGDDHDAVHGPGPRAATAANAPAPRSCSATCATRSPASPGPANSSPASRASTSNPARGDDRRVRDRPDPARLLRRGHAPRDRTRGRPRDGRPARPPSSRWTGPEREIAPNDRVPTRTGVRSVR